MTLETWEIRLFGTMGALLGALTMAESPSSPMWWAVISTLVWLYIALRFAFARIPAPKENPSNG